MAATGKLEKMLILAFDTAEDAERGGTLEAKARFEALINPRPTRSSTRSRRRTARAGHQRGADQVRVHAPRGADLRLPVRQHRPDRRQAKPDGVFDDVDAFRKLLTEYQSDSHEPYHLKLVWGNLIFKGRAIEVGITYKLFNPDGQPIRAVVRVKFKGSIEEKKRASLEDPHSADLTHRRTVRPGDTLPFMCFEVYGDPRHYLFVADFNQLDDFRRLTVGRPILFPPFPQAARR